MHGVTDRAVRNQAKKRGWARMEDEPDWHEPMVIPKRHEPEMSACATVAIAGGAHSSSAPELVKRGHGIILALMAELEVENSNINLLAELVEIETAEDRSPHRRHALQKALSLPIRAQAAKNLASALSTLRDAAPSKKDEAQANAKTAGQETGWGDDLAFRGGPPN